MLLIGVGVSLIHVGPSWLLRAEMDRTAIVGQIALTGIHYDHWFTTLFAYDVPFLSGDLSMRSMFITVPALAGLFFVERRQLTDQLALIATGMVAALLMSGGPILA